ncbi:MAG: transketolase [Anaerolineales bacterium]|nr:MAG: transketolase [Anaerolineales bacterium]
METDIGKLEDLARQIRRDIVKMIHLAGDGHPGPSLSVADIVTALYFAIMKVDPSRPQWDDRDRMILSKGHACPAVYAALARKGYFSRDVYPTLRHINSILQGHPDVKKTPGIDATAGSLGNGISIGLGMALAARLQGKAYFTYVVTGDGELNEGVIWEALMAAKNHNAGNLIVFVDNNEYQSGGSVRNISGILPLLPKVEAFGWHCQEIDGHNIAEILKSIKNAQAVTDTPSIIIAHTQKGKGVPFMEGNNAWHKRAPTREEFQQAMVALGGVE